MTAGDVYLTSAELAHRAGELGAEIASDYEGRDLLLVVPLKGCVVFATDLSRCIRIPLERYQWFHSARADLLRRQGKRDEAATAYHRALDLVANETERAFLERRLAEL